MQSTEVYAARARDLDILEKSSSGGIFAVIAKQYIEHQDFIVCSTWAPDYLSGHVQVIKTPMDLYRAQGSKYFQCSFGEILKESCDLLKAHPGKKMLFCGTGCQAAMYRQFMNAHGYEENVICMDIVCHGVVSPYVWKEYIGAIAGEYEKINHVNFKDKRKSWKTPIAVASVKIHAQESEIFLYKYMKMFYSNTLLRASCYKCPYTTFERATDITIGDFWRIEDKHPEFYNPKGASVVIIHTEKGKKLFDSVSESLDIVQSSEFACQQPHMIKPTQQPANREKIWKAIKKNGVMVTMNKYGVDTIIDKLYRRLPISARQKIGGGYSARNKSYRFCAVLSFCEVAA